MLSKLILLCSLITGSASMALHPRTCDGETTTLFCYTKENSQAPQNINVTDVAWIANYLRAYSPQIRPGRLWAMRANETQDSQE